MHDAQSNGANLLCDAQSRKQQGVHCLWRNAIWTSPHFRGSPQATVACSVLTQAGKYCFTRHMPLGGRRRRHRCTGRPQGAGTLRDVLNRNAMVACRIITVGWCSAKHGLAPKRSQRQSHWQRASATLTCEHFCVLKHREGTFCDTRATEGHREETFGGTWVLDINGQHAPPVSMARKRAIDIGAMAKVRRHSPIYLKKNPPVCNPQH